MVRPKRRWGPGSRFASRDGRTGSATTTGLVVLAALVVACTAPGGPGATGGATGGTTGPATGTVTLGSNASDEIPKRATQAMVDHCEEETGLTVTINTQDHGKFQDAINSYLQGTPDDIFTWFAGYRMQFFAAQGLSTDISDVWAKIGDGFSDAFKTASTGLDGKQYFVPILNYPWVVIYRKSVFEDGGYEVPATFDDFLALAQQMQDDGLIPIALGDKDGWPAMGTFDILNMRINGYQFHVDLMAGKEKWTDPRILTVFEEWKKIIPFYQEGALGRTWQEAAKSMASGDAGMYFLGTFAAQQATPEQAEDLDFFAWPTHGTEFDEELGIDAPIDGYMLSKAPKNLAGAKAILECFGSAEAQDVFIAEDPNNVAAHNDADTSGYTPFQQKSAEIIGASGAIAQFLDRDTRPDFAGPNTMQAYLQDFLSNPDQDLEAFATEIQANYDALPPE
jgi:multiple sugar transport system substrate-binding protein